MNTTSGAESSAADPRDERGDGERDQPQRPEAARRRCPTSGPRDARDDPEQLHDREHRGGMPGREAAVVVQEQHGEADDAHLRREHERAPDRDPPEAPVAERRDVASRRRRPAAGISRRTSAPTTARDDARDPHRREAPAGAARHARSAAARATPAKPLIGIAVCRIPSASPRCEPGNHAITARPLADWTLAPEEPREHEQEQQRLERRRQRRAEQREAAPADAREQNPAARRRGRSRAPTGSARRPSRRATRR